MCPCAEPTIRCKRIVTWLHADAVLRYGAKLAGGTFELSTLLCWLYAGSAGTGRELLYDRFSSPSALRSPSPPCEHTSSIVRSRQTARRTASSTKCLLLPRATGPACSSSSPPRRYLVANAHTHHRVERAQRPLLPTGPSCSGSPPPCASQQFPSTYASHLHQTGRASSKRSPLTCDHFA